MLKTNLPFPNRAVTINEDIAKEWDLTGITRLALEKALPHFSNITAILHENRFTTDYVYAKYHGNIRNKYSYVGPNFVYEDFDPYLNMTGKITDMTNDLFLPPKVQDYQLNEVSTYKIEFLSLLFRMESEILRAAQLLSAEYANGYLNIAINKSLRDKSNFIVINDIRQDAIMGYLRAARTDPDKLIIPCQDYDEPLELKPIDEFPSFILNK